MGAIEVTDLAMAYGDLKAVDGVSFEVAEGEFFGILGPNGAGKTTTLEMIEGLRRPDAGTITVLGETPWPRNAALLPRMGVQLQASSFFERLTAREQIHTFASLYAVSADPGRRVARAGGARRQGRQPGRGPVRRSEPTALDRLRTGPRSRGRVPRRADRGARPAGPPQPVGPAVRAQRQRPHGGAHHALHGRGRGALRPGRRSWTTASCSSSTPEGADPRRSMRPPGSRSPPSELDRGRPSMPWSGGRQRHRRARADDAPAGRRTPKLAETGHLDGISVATGTLEDVFLDVTGREYRRMKHDSLRSAPGPSVEPRRIAILRASCATGRRSSSRSSSR